MKKLLILGIISCAALVLNSCYYDKYDELTAASKLTSTCDSANVSYSKSIAPIMASYCNNCHSSSLSTGGYALDNYAGVLKSVTNNKLLPSVNHTGPYPMPQGSSAKLNDCKLKIIENWVNAGAKNN